MKISLGVLSGPISLHYVPGPPVSRNEADALFPHQGAIAFRKDEE